MSDEAAPQANGASPAKDVTDAVAETGTPAETRPFSWLQPHPIFVIILVGPDETPFGIQKNFLVAKSSFYKKHFDENPNEAQLEHIVKLSDTPVEVFAYTQNYLYTGQVFPSLENLPTYEVLIGVWKLAHHLGIDGLCDATLEAMAECRRVTQHIPATPLLVQVWEDTPEGSSIRKLLLSWAAEYMRSSESRAEFAQSLPQKVLSELVVAMSSLDSPTAIPIDVRVEASTSSTQKRPAANTEPDGSEARPTKISRGSDAGTNRAAPAVVAQPSARKQGPRASLPATKPGPKPGGRRRASAAVVENKQFSSNQKLNFCADLLMRMLSGPGFWTRVVGPFKEPVDPERDGVPDYFDVVKKPMDLSTMKAKMDRREYADEQEFLADMTQIFNNCYTYWNETDPMWAACEKLQRSFEEKFNQMNKWIAKMDGDEEN